MHAKGNDLLCEFALNSNELDGVWVWYLRIL